MASAVASIWQGITYRGREGHYAWLLHRVGGLGIMAFLLLHILDIFLVGFGPEIFGKFLILYTWPPFKIAELGLIFGVVYHAFNGVRIILVDFWPNRFSNLRMQRNMFPVSYTHLLRSTTCAVRSQKVMSRTFRLSLIHI